jgi:hypothetical protein
MYRASCTVYFPDQQMHSLYVLTMIYISSVALHILMHPHCRRIRPPWDDAGPTKHVWVLTIYKILLIYVVHLLVWVIKTALFAIPPHNTASSLPFLHLRVLIPLMNSPVRLRAVIINSLSLFVLRTGQNGIHLTHSSGRNYDAKIYTPQFLHKDT